MQAQERRIQITVLGVGCAGCRVVERLLEDGVCGARFVTFDADCGRPWCWPKPGSGYTHIRSAVNRGLGCGGDPAMGARAAEADAGALREALQGADLAFVVLGLGGGMGGGAGPVVARIAREVGALTIGMITTPFGIEGQRRARLANDGLAALKSAVDSLLVIPSDRVASIANGGTKCAAAFSALDGFVADGIRELVERRAVPGIISWISKM